MDSNAEATPEQHNDKHRDSVSPAVYRLLRECFASNDTEDEEEEETEPGTYLAYCVSILRGILADAANEAPARDLRGIAHLVWIAENWATAD